ncbi:N-acetylglutamate synthase [Methylacidiphilum kamchatkense Kam1]|uniref:amino-acid N-acetyltransferase n=1 Tax=Methylacidiphilum kamchatkense Kam1 TaxID=1202785 RepID=A0A0C1UT81_9BACT|nr:amino-acid N-acetyltransferase [Methylacidiphilum kamchatkense]KIE59023.1 N-acetylglutamate synthase [Methylacidiphilum kamchatkense Kam1]QDQ43080.1 N-acetylglutamate synthase [Methylacidiphilum kamchatkense Kam1]
MNVSDLRGILAYIPQFREKVFVIAIDGAIAASENFPNLVLDLAVLRSVAIKVVLVHGIAHQLKQLSLLLHTDLSDTTGIGITDQKTHELSLIASSKVTFQILEALSASDLRACATNAIIAHPFGIVSGVDYQLTGRINKIDVPFIEYLLQKNIIPVIGPIGFDGEGKSYRINSDAVAQCMAEALHAEKLIYLTTYPGILDNEGNLIRELDVQAAQEFHKNFSKSQPEQLRSKLEHAIHACKNGVNRVHIIDGRMDEALLSEIFSNTGIGTMIYANQYESIRPARKKDIGAILKLIQEPIESDEILPRKAVDIARDLQSYYVFELDKQIVGCMAVYPYPKTSQAELACLSVAKSHENQGIGRKMIHYAEKLASQQGFKQLFLLSTRAYVYFMQKGGFKEADPSILPLERKIKYEKTGRNSKVLYKPLQ